MSRKEVSTQEVMVGFKLEEVARLASQLNIVGDSFDRAIVVAVKAGASLREIAAATGRAHSTIAERLRRIERTKPEESEMSETKPHPVSLGCRCSCQHSYNLHLVYDARGKADKTCSVSACSCSAYEHACREPD